MFLNDADALDIVFESGEHIKRVTLQYVLLLNVIIVERKRWSFLEFSNSAI